MVNEQEIDQVENSPDVIHLAFADRGYDPDVIEKLVQIYAPPGNQVTDDGLLCHQENHLYLLKWLIPALGNLPQTLFFILHWARRSRTKSEQLSQ